MQIEFRKVDYIYKKNTPLAARALHDINLTLPSKRFIAIIGHTGSGKSTLLQHLNGLLTPTKGSMKIGDEEIIADQKNKALKKIRQKVGIVFQFPEYQLFEETVEKDICFGPMNYGVSRDNAKEKSSYYLKMVGLDDSYLGLSPFELSGGQMRRVAIAGILAMEPEVLVLDEPTAGLDPYGSREIMEIFARMHQSGDMTTILVTHNMEDAARFADEIVVMESGEIMQTGSPEMIFSNAAELERLGLKLPKTVQFQKMFEAQSGCLLSKVHLNEEDLVAEICTLVNGVTVC